MCCCTGRSRGGSWWRGVLRNRFFNRRCQSRSTNRRGAAYAEPSPSVIETPQDSALRLAP